MNGVTIGAAVIGQMNRGRIPVVSPALTGDPLPEGFVVSGGSVIHRTMRVSVCTRAFANISTIERFVAGRVTDTANEPSTLELTIERSDPLADYLSKPNRIRLWGVDDALLNTFEIWNEGTPEEDAGAKWKKIICQDLLSTLSRETVDEDYEHPYAEGRTVREHLAALFEYQVNDPVITLGIVDAVIGDLVRGLNVSKGTSVLEAIRMLHDQVGG